MAETVSTVPDGSLLGVPQGMLALRIHGTERDGQIVRLRASKVAIGASPHCALRLRAPGVDDTHCIILRGQQRTVVRCCSPDTRLNGAGFDEAELHVGDLLSIGPIELEVVDDSTADTRTTTAGEQATEAAAQDQGNLEGQRNSLDQEWQRLARERAASESSLAEREAEFARRIEALERRLADMDNERRQLDLQRNELQLQRRQLEAESAGADPQIPSSRRPDDEPQPTPVLSESALQAEDPAAEQDIAAPRSALADQEEDLFARLRALDVLKQGSGEDAAEESPAVEPDEAASGSDEPSMTAADESSSPEGVEPPSQAGSSPPASPAARASAAENEESIDDYMARLLQRMRGGSTSDALQSLGAPPRVERQRIEPEPEASEQEEAASPDPTSGLTPVAPAPPALSKLEPRKAPPERIQNLAAMRELANITARTAIASHHERRVASHAAQKLLLAVIALAFAVLLVFWAPFGSFYWLGGLVGLIASLVWFIQVGGLLSSKHVTKRVVRTPGWDLPAVDEESNPPADDETGGAN